MSDTKLTLNASELDRLNALLLETPYKYASPMVQLINLAFARNEQEKKECEQPLPPSPSE
ncbi:MAG: hypothetical protein AzoDbin1_05442 [Azoarcus sp.]|nr:hypothetical protein [Azoarcus sp.]